MRGRVSAGKAGPEAANKAGELFKTALDYLRRSPKGEMIADNFAEDPATYEKPLAKELQAAVESDTDLAAQLEKLWAEYEEATKAYGGDSYQAALMGGGAIAQGEGADGRRRARLKRRP